MGSTKPRLVTPAHYAANVLGCAASAFPNIDALAVGRCELCDNGWSLLIRIRHLNTITIHISDLQLLLPPSYTSLKDTGCVKPEPGPTEELKAATLRDYLNVNTHNPLQRAAALVRARLELEIEKELNKCE